MGLDMYVYISNQPVCAEVDFSLPEDVREFHYWRKHPNLHGWMENRYRSKGGESELFNCVPLRLTDDDLDDLEAAIRQRKLPLTYGFFFGESDGSEMEEDLHFVKKARAALRQGFTIIYDSWW